jgi:CHASE3 domain sensor protein
LHLLIVGPAQAQRLNLLESLAKSEVDAVQAIVVARQKSGNIPPVIVFARGKRIMDAARDAVADMRLAEERVLQERTRRSLAARRFSVLVIVLGTLLGASPCFLPLPAIPERAPEFVSSRPGFWRNSASARSRVR